MHEPEHYLYNRSSAQDYDFTSVKDCCTLRHERKVTPGEFHTKKRQQAISERTRDKKTKRHNHRV
ncbi:predicted protein [Nematostella vectensis]|uniref:Uncharacterized protein n=1 Tax=Nematostella vectensis TaxID=45351 RepID=A7SPG7_NEMVE|nr:predicted protein [Nematostella vectensis]|eukprot:XP_001626488.1 predicted protein [Nematostella vectensis]